MNPPVLTQFGLPDPNAAPLNITQLVVLLNTLVSSAIQGSYAPYVLQNATPGVQDQDKAWIALDSSGRPIALKIFYSGTWRRVYNGMIGEIRMYSGDPSVDFDTDGRGNVGGEFDGWQLCNGNNGSPDLSDKFLIAGHMNNSSGHTGYSGGWQTFVDGTSDQKTGGNDKITLDASHTYTPDIPAVRARKFHADGNAPEPHTGDLWGTKSGTDGDNDDIAPAITGNTSPTSISILNPFIAMGFITFIGYA